MPAVNTANPNEQNNPIEVPRGIENIGLPAALDYRSPVPYMTELGF